MTFLSRKLLWLFLYFVTSYVILSLFFEKVGSEHSFFFDISPNFRVGLIEVPQH